MAEIMTDKINLRYKLKFEVDKLIQQEIDQKWNRYLVKIYTLTVPGWSAFVLRKYFKEVVTYIKQIPPSDKFFYKEVINRFKVLSIWCVKSNQAEAIKAVIEEIPRAEIKIVDIEITGC